MARGIAWMAVVGLAAAGLGCGTASPAPLRPQEFLPISHPGIENGTISRQTDQNGTLVYGELHEPLLPDEYTNNPAAKRPIHISSVVHEAVAGTRPGGSIATSVPTSLPAPFTRPGLVSNYQIVGTVIATVKGRPIYADKVLAGIEPTLAADARRLDREAFRSDAADVIEKHVERLIADQVRLAAAEEFLNADSKLQADRIAEIWRNEQITAAGGSLEMAKERVRRQTGLSFEEEARNQRDLALVEIYYEEKVFPLVNVSPSEIRRYYDQNLSTEFTRTAAVKFHLIKIDIARRGGPEEAARVVHDILAQLHAGKDFTQLAHEKNDDPVLMQSGGAVLGGNWVEKGGFVNDKVENAVWKLHPGEFTDPPIEDHDSPDPAFYIALLDARQAGAVKSFNDPDVQALINNTLRRQQFSVLQHKWDEKLQQQAVTVRDPNGLQAALDMAMEWYAGWRGER